MDVSIIVVAWNVRQLVYDCLKSVYDQTKGVSFEVIYVDNASQDGSVDMVRTAFPEVRIIENSENLGFIRANNQAIEVATGRYVLLLNSDTIVLDNAIAKTVRFADEHTDAAVIGCRVLNRDGSLQRSCFMYPSALNFFLSSTYLYKIFPRSRFFGRERMTWWDFDDVREVETVCGCYSLVRRKAIDQVGVMDPTYFVYGDDPDWCYRFKKAGWKILFTPEPRIIHFGGQTTKQMARQFKLQLFGSKLIFIRLHRNSFQFLIARIFVSLFCFFRMFYWFFSSFLVNTEKRRESRIVSKTCMIGSYYALFRWKEMLMNRDVVQDKL